MRFALEVRPGRPAASEFAESLTEELTDAGGEVVSDVEERPDLVIAVGGDGTMLGAVRRSISWDVPVLGFNLGTLGFLAAAEAEDLQAVVKRLTEGDFEVEERTTVAATVGGVTAVGVNDVVVEKIDSTRLISLDVIVDGAPFVTYRADGLIVATPTGSTAYSFSAGGPLIDSSLDAIVMTPVAAHSLFDRPLVFPSSTVIEVQVSRDRNVMVHVDKANLGELGEGESVKIHRGDRPARFVSFGGTSFPSLVKNKFGLR